MSLVGDRSNITFFGSLRHKLIFVIVVALSLAMLIASLFFVIYDREGAKKNLHESVSAMAKITVERSVAALAFYDKHTADQNLSALLIVEHIRVACLYDRNGELFSSVANPDFLALRCEFELDAMKERLGKQEGYLTVHLPAAKKNKVYGDLFIVADLSHLYGRMLNIIGASLAVSLLSSLIAYLLTIKLQNRLINPIESLSGAVDRVTHTQDYSIRAQRLSNDEVGRLVDSFNGMLQRIEGAQEKLHEMVDELEDQSVRLKHHVRHSEVQREEVQTMWAAASHDLKQPLQAMSMYIAALRDEPEKSDILMNKLERSIENMRQLFVDLMDVSSLEKRVKSEIQVDEVFIPDLFDQLLSEYEIVAQQKGLIFDIKTIDITLGTYVFTLQRIIRNLLNNAFHYTSSGHITLVCRRKNNAVLIEVWDTGVGIPKGEIGDVFREFVQVSENRELSSQGMGLGLSIVKRCCKLLDYTVEVKSKYGRGSIFRIGIPMSKILPKVSENIVFDAVPEQGQLHKEGAILKASVSSDKQAVPSFSSFLNRLAAKRVLLIDDDPLVRDSITCLLDGWGIDVTSFDSVVACMEYLVSRPEYIPDVIVSDYQLGAEELGSDLIEQLRAHYGMEVPALLITGVELEATITQLKSEGFYVLRKPVKPAKLRALIESLTSESL